jgi:hypothetical protein
MKPVLKFLSFLILLTFVATNAFAGFENWEPSPWTKESTYVEKCVGKFGFGILNVLTGWTAIFWEPTRYSNPFTGVAKGIWRTVTNTAGGALHAATFPIPIDIPLPDGGVHFDEEAIAPVEKETA